MVNLGHDLDTVSQRNTVCCSKYLVVTVIEGGISQAVPEHPKRDNIFSLSTAFGDAYLFQVSFYVIVEQEVF